MLSGVEHEKSFITLGSSSIWPQTQYFLVTQQRYVVGPQWKSSRN